LSIVAEGCTATGYQSLAAHATLEVAVSFGAETACCGRPDELVAVQIWLGKVG
jgi:hypothetical protein